MPVPPLEPLRLAHGAHQRLLALLAAEVGNLWVLVTYAVGSGILALAIPLAVQALVNSIALGTTIQPVVVLSLLLFLAQTFQGLMQALQTYIVELVQRRLFVHVAVDLAYRLPRVRPEAFDREHGPELVNRFFGVFTMQKSASILLLDGITVGLQVVIGMLLLAFYHPLLLAFDLLLVAALAFVLLVLGRGATATALGESHYKYGMAAWLEELALHPGAFRSTPAARYVLERTDRLASHYLRERGAHFRVLFRQLLGLLTLQALAGAALLGVGGWLVVQRQLTLGQLVASEFVVAIVVGGFVKMAKHIEAYFDMVAAAEKLAHLAELPLEREGGAAYPVGGPARLGLRGLRWAYPGGPEVLRGLALDVEAGGRIGIFGGHGEGKSALLDLMAGRREPTGGAIEVDGLDLRDLDPGELRARIALVRASEVFAGTVLENLQLGQASVDLAAARGTLEAVGLWEEIQALPEGLSTPLATGGYPLSPREAGRLALARALCARPRALLIDEALDALDERCRERVLDAFFAPDAPWTLVVLGRDPAVLRRCDRLYRLESGALHPVPRDGRLPV
jgi:ABC-type bacteriocin/lantibiotic exporter with double-glycine peptidase domain